MRCDTRSAAPGPILALAAAAILFGAVAPAGAEERVPLRWDHYYDHDEVTGTLRELARAYPDLARLETIGRSAEGRDILALTITNERTGAALSKPGIYADGAIHGNEIQATEVCLYLAVIRSHSP